MAMDPLISSKGKVQEVRKKKSQHGHSQKYKPKKKI